MSANVITFEGQYMADQMRNIDRAKTLTEEAMSIIKSASQHRNWRCNETREIDNGIDIISRRLQRLNMGIIRTGNALGKGLVSFTELEKRSESQANTLSSNLQNNYGFEATDRTTSSDTTLPTLMLPAFPMGRITAAILTKWFNEVNRRIKEFWDNFLNRNRKTDNNNGYHTPTSVPPVVHESEVEHKAEQEHNSETPLQQVYDNPKQTIWNFLREKIGNDYGVAALMGNLNAESGFSANNLQNTYERSLGLNDDEYTAAVDNGSYSNFVNDKAGYGIAQWTYHSRKQGLLNFAREKGTSVGDLQTQLEYLWKELSEGYRGILNALKNATSIREASDIVLKEFERPANQSESACAYRAGLGEAIYSEFMG